MGRQHPLATAALLLALGGLYLFVGAQWQPTNDVQSAAVQAWALGTTGHLDTSGSGVEPTRWEHDTRRGLVSDRFPAVWASAVPAYAVAGLLGDGFSMWPALVTAVLLGLLTVVLVWRALGPWVASALALATPQLAIAGTALWSHAVTGPALAGVLLASKHRRWGWVGFCLAVGILARPSLAVPAAVIGVGASVALRSWRPVLAVGAWSTSAVAALVGWSYWLGFPGPMPGTYSAQWAALSADRNRWVDLLGLAVSPERGWLLFVPVLLVLLPVAAYRLLSGRVTPWEAVTACAAVASLAAQLWPQDFRAGTGFYGPRYGWEAAMFALPLLAAAGRMVAATTWRRVALAGTVAAGSLAGLLGVLAYAPNPDEPLPRAHPWVVQTGDSSGFYHE